MDLILIGFALVAVALLVAIGRRPDLLAGVRGRVLGLVAFALLPGLVLAGGYRSHVERSKTTDFCLSCHVMEPYGQSLRVDDAELLAASHFQNRRVDRSHACYTCHTTYTMYGPMKSKMAGLGHVWKYYVAGYPDKLELREPYQNRECLHCHGGARSFEESDAHVDDLADLKANKTSCLECHSEVHAIEGVAEATMWTERP